MSSVVRLRIRDFRAYTDTQIEIGDRLTVIHGPNGAGKTNLVEALYFGCTGHSCRTRNERELVRFGAEATRVELELHAAGGEHTIAVGYEPGESKRMTADGAPVERLLDVPFRPLVCVFLPDRLDLVKGAPALRRSHLDQFIAALWPARVGTRRAYAQALQQRNALLGRVRAGAPAADLRTWDLELGRHALALRADRERATALIAPGAATLARDVGLCGDVEIRYRPRSTADSPEQFAAELTDRLTGDLERGFTGHGPHRDDLMLLRDGRDLRTYGSQGEQRLALLTLLIAEREALSAERGQAPLLLLDDVMSELDPERRSALIARVTRVGQCVVTTADRDHVPVADGVPVLPLEVDDASVRPEAVAA